MHRKILPLIVACAGGFGIGAGAPGSSSASEGTAQIDLSELTIARIHEAYRTGEYTAEALARAYLARITEHDDETNAITERNGDVLVEARSLDRELEETGELRPLHGIPVLVKDNVNTAGMPTTAGALALANFVPEQDAFVVSKLKEAGAIVIAKTNMAEWAFSPRHTESSTDGITRNPYNLAHVPAGSSGGTAAGVAANFATVGLGTDTGNSIRGPSSHTALVGFRPTLGLISRSAIVPLFLRNDVVGPMCRTVEDCTRVMQAMVGVDPDDPLTTGSAGRAEDDYLRHLDAEGLQGARIGVLRQLSDDDPDPEVAALFDRALDDLEAQGAELVDPADVPDFESLSENQWCATFRTDLEAFLATYVDDPALRTLEDVHRIGSTNEFARTRVEDALTDSGRYGGGPACGDVDDDVRRVAFREAIENTMDRLELDAIVHPTWNNPPARIELFNEEYKGDNNQIIAPHTGQPAFTVPMGYTGENLPAGLQFLGRMYDEPTLITFSYAFEQATRHRRPPDLR